MPKRNIAKLLKMFELCPVDLDREDFSDSPNGPILVSQEHILSARALFLIYANQYGLSNAHDIMRRMFRREIIACIVSEQIETPPEFLVGLDHFDKTFCDEYQAFSDMLLEDITPEESSDFLAELDQFHMEGVDPSCHPRIMEKIRSWRMRIFMNCERINHETFREMYTYLQRNPRIDHFMDRALGIEEV